MSAKLGPTDKERVAAAPIGDGAPSSALLPTQRLTRCSSVLSPGRVAPQFFALAVGALAAVLYPLPFPPYFQTVGFLILLNAMLGIGWNVIGGWAGQFDFGPNVFFAIGAYTVAVTLIHLGLNPWLG